MDLKDIRDLIQALSKVFELVLNIADIIDSAVEKINSLDIDEARMKQQLEVCKQKLTTAKSNSKVYTGSVQKLFQFANIDKKEVKKMKKDYKEDMRCLNEYFTQIQRYLAQSDAHYEDFLSSLEDSEDQCKTTRLLCEEKTIVAKKRKIVSRVVGAGAATAGIGAVVGGGVTASIVAGMFTFGIGTAVGLGLTALATSGLAAAGAGTAGIAGVASHLIARKVRTTLQEICNDFDTLSAKASKLKEKMSEIRNEIFSVSDDKDNVLANIVDQVHYEQFCRVFDIFMQGIKEASKRFNVQD